MLSVIFSLYFITSTSCFSTKTFKGAVYDHVVVLPDNRHERVNRSFALDNMMKNIIVYKEQARLAGTKVCINTLNIINLL